MSKGTVITLVIIGCILLAIASVALWASLNLFNASRFGAHVAEGLQSPEATQALAVPIVDELLVNNPDVPPLAKQAAVEIVTWLLQRPLFTPVIEKTVAVVSTAMTTSAQDVVGIDLAEVISNGGAAIVGVISQIDPAAGEAVQTALDNRLATSEASGFLAIYEQGRFPQLRQLSNMTPWLALIGGLGAIVLFIVAAVQARDRHQALKYTGIGIMVTAGLSFLLFAPVVQGTAQNNLTDPTMQAVVGAVVTVLIRSFAIQSLLLLFIGVIVLVVNHAQVQPAEQSQAASASSAAKAQPADPAPASSAKAPPADPAPAATSSDNAQPAASAPASSDKAGQDDPASTGPAT
ncbi:MAG: hypothetical protein OES12_05185 [Anaerolineae bacterium]|nr:hypothetical protein [Anaerolineae bacterium]